ncbi:NAD(+) diphosphatase [Microcella humidisoli]|uniref:NAD(+) diphosphatase n=1 Tax=Microcella humidisoli TaxID=2963406 RepID=A0ABY5FTY5_9MICO|nr:NAD(+) diphosphatase [Microcella humidisoli]UTT61755.1 NAD(+) diphosphatase [Microcella humidisoli]
MPRSLTQHLPLSRYRIDRDHAARDRPQLFDELAADPDARIVALWRGEVLLTTARDAATAPALALLPWASAPAEALRIYLGRTLEAEGGVPAGAAITAVVLDDESGPALEADVTRWASPRTLGHRLGDRDAGLAIEALGLANWHDTHRFSPRTGNPTVAAKAGWVRVDVETGAELFPRTDAAVIVGITDADDRLVLGSNALWESNRFSLLAGFVEPGESLEAAVVREVFEESGLRVIDAEYVGSQPWPFPASLMLGFRARLDPAHANDLRPDGAEILDLRWFSRDELAASLGEILLPGRTSIARAIIEDWFGGSLDAP